ncbi:putative epsin [Leptomonas seymouri]|uniref:Putative epsin n=1 Tax=Leptomonas seymouri TaxID=5684 RepID=A0A0N1PCI1_LEPSE|nr:putative epsin [Leptomonas seymouri]|eukprot:KPI87322.1 putative epsin [Leptomonas seymouri]
MNFTQQLWSVKEWGRVMATGNEYVTIVHEATNEDKWGPTGAQMEAVCNAYPRGGQEILTELRSRLNNRDKAWRPCYKSLLVLDYLARNVADRYLPEICALVPLMRTISTSFYYTNPKGIDHGVSVRERARKLAELLSDGLQLREERVVAAQTREKLSHNASEGGGPQNYGAYGGAGNGYNTGYGGGYGGGYSGGYDSYRPSSSNTHAHAPPPSSLRTKEEQERYDMELAMRMQRDEERRAGVSAERLEEMYANKIHQKKSMEQRQRTAADDDEALARRLQEEEENRARREGRSLPTLRSDSQPSKTPDPAPAKAASLAAPAPEPAMPKEPEASALDDLFAPAPVAPQPAAAAKPADPFDAFLDSRISQSQPPLQQQQQPNPWGQPPAQPANNWSQPQQPTPPQQQPSNPWGQPQQSEGNWGQPQQSQQQPQPSNPWGQPQQSGGNWGQPQPSNPWGQPQQSGGNWGQPQQSQQQPQPSNPWGQPQQSGGNWGQPQQSQQQPQPSNPWGQPQQSQVSASWGQPPAAAPTPGSQSNNANSDMDNMWGTLGQFTSQQQRK